MEGHAKKYVERYCELANKTTEQFFNVATPCMDDHQFKDEENESLGELSTVCSQFVLKCLYLARIVRADILYHTCEYRQHCYVGNTAQQCRSGLFQDFDFAGDFEDSKSTSGGILCIFGSHTFVPTSWMCKKQTSVSDSSTEDEVIFLDGGLRMGGIPALDLWDLVIEVFHSSPNQATGKPVGNSSVKHAKTDSNRQSGSDQH